MVLFSCLPFNCRESQCSQPNLGGCIVSSLTDAMIEQCVIMFLVLTASYVGVYTYVHTDVEVHCRSLGLCLLAVDLEHMRTVKKEKHHAFAQKYSLLRCVCVCVCVCVVCVCVCMCVVGGWVWVWVGGDLPPRMKALHVQCSTSKVYCG